MRNNFFSYLTEFFAILSIVVNSIQFLLFSLVGIEYDPEGGTGLVAIVNVGFCLFTIAWVIINETTGKRPVHHVTWPYILPFVIIFLFFVESAINPNLTLSSFAGKRFIFFGVFAVPTIFFATYIYRHDRFDIVTRNSDIIMLICTLALGLNLPTMMSSGIGNASIGGGGGHQEISYSAAFCFLINWINIVTGNKENRFNIFQKKIWRYIFFILLPIQAITCILGGGRGGSVLLIIGFIATILVFSRRRLSSSLPWIILAVTVLAYLGTQIGDSAEGFGRIFDYIGSNGIDLTSDTERYYLRQTSYNIIAESPIIGHGLWNGIAYAHFYAHNIFLDVLISGGLIYLLLFLFIMVRCFRGCVKILKNDCSKSVFLAWILYPGIMLLFSGFYLCSSLFWFVSLYAYLVNRGMKNNKVMRIKGSRKHLNPKLL